MRLASGATLEDIHGATDNWRLPVEPLSRRIPIARFLLEGGYGYGSLTEGSLASKILNISWSRDGKSYHYGLEKSTLYNAGYTLQRIIDMGTSRLLGMELGEIESLTLLVGQVSTPTVQFRGMEAEQIVIPPDATDAVFLNEKSASVVGLNQAGLLIVSAQGGSSDGAAGQAWEMRYLEDALPEGLEKTRLLAVKSDLPALLEAAGSESYVVVLGTLKGFVANIYCPKQTKNAVEEKAESLKHCYLL